MLTPFAGHLPLGRPSGLNVQGIEGGIADHADAGLAAFRLHPFQGFARHLQKGGSQEPGNPVIAAGALQLSGQEILQRTAAGGIPTYHKAIWSLSRSVSLFPSFFDEIQKALRRKGDETSGLEVPVNVPILRDNIIDLHEVGEGCYQRIRLLQALLLPVFLKGRLGHFNQIVTLDLLRRLDQSEEILFKVWGKIPLYLPENNLRNKETEFFRFVDEDSNEIKQPGRWARACGRIKP
jgi:hypothetical protein